MSTVKPQRFKYDVFISYSHRSKEWVRDWLLPRLKSAGLKVCIDHEDFAPGAPLLTEMERAVLQSRKTALILTPEYLQSSWAEFENILVQTLDPTGRDRRLIPVFLLSCALPLRIGSLTYIDFTRLEDQARNVEHLIAALRSRPTVSRRRRTVVNTGFPMAVPTGPLSPNSDLYIERDHDRLVLRTTSGTSSTILVEGARQMGKSSLLARALHHARQAQCTVLDFDFQNLDDSCFNSLETLLHSLADAIAERLQLAVSQESIWQGPRSLKEKLTSFVRNHVLHDAHRPVVIVMDEVDRVFGRSYQDDFFGLLRTWHGMHAKDPLWERFNMVLAYSTDPRQAIKALNQSPFNVGTKILLRDFSFDEVWELNGRYQRPLKRKDQLQSLMSVIGGHPYLAQQALHSLATQTYTLPRLLDIGKAESGPFADHLESHRGHLVSRPELHRAMRQVLGNGNCPTHETFVQLRAVGLVTGETYHAVLPRCQLYTAYFQRVLL